ncbi:MAG: Na+/H+ antiporter subunit D, partial [Actinomycetota bacterium]|nr:Na+/H+ antiporter subunit D [Actinomycetota bacterium]
MSTPLLAIPVVVPIFGAALSILVGIRRELQRLVTIAALSVTVVVSIIVLIRVDEHGHLVANSGGWSAPLGIALVVDRFAAIMLVVSTVVLLIVAIYAIGQGG